MPALLKPAPTRLRLVLWSLQQNLGEFPESPPPGLVTIPSDAGAPAGADTMSGYRKSGTRAIRIDMLERLADMLRAEDSRSGFEAKADMLSISGTTLEQFADLMQGLGYAAEKGERAKVKTVAEVIPEAAKDVTDTTPVMDVADAPAAGGIIEDPSSVPPADVPENTAAIVDDGVAPIAEEPTDEAEVGPGVDAVSETEVPQGTAPDADVAGAEMETFYTFTWARQPRRQSGSERPRGKGKPGARGKKPATRAGDKPTKSQNFSSRPAKKEKQIDPDNPFAAALMGLKSDK